MADLNKASVKRQLSRVHAHGNVQRARYQYAASGVAQNDVIYLTGAQIPAFSWVEDIHAVVAALGASTGLTFKLVKNDGSDYAGGTLATVADTSSATNTRGAFAPFWVDEDVYVVAVQTGSGAATGDISATVDYVYEGT